MKEENMYVVGLLIGLGIGWLAWTIQIMGAAWPVYPVSWQLFSLMR